MFYLEFVVCDNYKSNNVKHSNTWLRFSVFHPIPLLFSNKDNWRHPWHELMAPHVPRPFYWQKSLDFNVSTN